MFDKLKIGIMDLLTILLPGGMLLMISCFDTSLFFCANRPGGDTVVYELLRVPFNGLVNGNWFVIAVYISLSYICGHFVFSIASWMDELTIKVVETLRKVAPKQFNWLVNKFNKNSKKREELINMAAECQRMAMSKHDKDVFNAYKWCNFWLISYEPIIYAEVEKYTAESKFFRSLVIIFILLLVWSLFGKETNWTYNKILLALVVLSFWRYRARRSKSIITACQGVLTTFRKHNDGSGEGKFVK